MSRLRWGSHTHHELNYLVSEKTALRVREYVQCHLDFHEYSVGRPNYSYPVHTLYLDSDDLALYWKAINDVEHRCQLRVRYYSAHPEAPVHLEVKRRQADVVRRLRCEIRPEAIFLVLAGHLADEQHLASGHPAHLFALQVLIALLRSLGAKPKLHVAYQRECYVSDDETVRVTMDREIACEASDTAELNVRMDHPCPLFRPCVLLELSFGERFPDWLRGLVEHFSLKECEADKYFEGISALGHPFCR